MTAGPFARLMVSLCIAVHMWFGCAPGGLRFCATAVVGSECSCCCSQVEEAADEQCCCDESVPVGDVSLGLGDCGCCIGVPAVPVPLTLDGRAGGGGQIENSAVIVLAAGELLSRPGVVAPVEVCRWQPPPDPGRARVAAGLSSTRLMV